MIKQVFTDLKAQFTQDFHERPLVLFLEAVGTLFSVGAGGTIAYYAASSNMLLVLIAYLIGAICWFIAARIRNNSFLLALNLIYGFIDVFGIAKILLPHLTF